MGNNDDIQLDLNQDQAGQVVQNVPAGAQTTLAFRVEQSKIPDFWGQKAKPILWNSRHNSLPVGKCFYIYKKRLFPG